MGRHATVVDPAQRGKKSPEGSEPGMGVTASREDFAPLALGITEEAKRDRITMPALSYKTEPTVVANTSKGLLQGPLTGRYEDLRRFIHNLETADELLFIEDLELTRSGDLRDDALTFNIKIATYLRTDSEKPILSATGQ